ncbi:S4 domain-containing protein [Colletotrichum costaricense]|uniref:S4 domain-containing protein n=1 Tax=Colletotrichum costaricense TaxID=1209916 RepID=A0AAI9YLG5_9PEZI|nr:S4 domain-containing protein [Colletotrichum costaricense]KAK1515094.1 S4 domain-containing protein [Colletotrichum costaricense]
MRGRKPRWYNLAKPKIRQSWNKYNLFNLATFKLKRNRTSRTFFQQKWTAKSMTRGYHGAHVKEAEWSRNFSRRLFSAVDMPPEYLAKHDGSEHSAGRGSGLHAEPGSEDLTPTAYHFSKPEEARQRREADNRFARVKADPQTEMLARPVREMTPYMQMAFAPLERRLDVAIFRAMFASSTLQAKQFCTHGAVKVNGKVMRYGAYKLNPGDMFQVDVDNVLFATGRAKTPNHALWLAGKDYQSLNDAGKPNKSAAKEGASEQESGDAALEAAEVDAAVEEVDAAAESGEAATEAAEAAADGEEGSQLSEEEKSKQLQKQLKSLVRSVKTFLSDKDGLKPSKKRQLRTFMAEAKRVLSTSGRVTDDAVATLDHEGVMNNLTALLKDFKLEGNKVEAVASPEAEGQEQAADHSKPTSAKEKAETEAVTDLISSKDVRNALSGLSKAEQKAFAELLRKHAENPIDESKPYWTPWQPRRYMSPFAFIPRYLEVNQNICAAVYLRHPVARRGLAEVPTPFTYETNQLAFNWYLRRG